MGHSLLVSLALLSPADVPPEPPRSVRFDGFNATVRVTDPATEMVGTGAVIASKDGFTYIVTAAHLLTRDSTPTIETFAAAKPTEADAAFEKSTVLFRTTDSDLAVVRVPAGKRVWSSLALAPETVSKGTVDRKGAPDRGWAIGCDDGKAPRLEDVAILGTKVVRKGKDGLAKVWQTKGKTVGGRSGGPLLDAKGRLLGLCSGTQGDESYYAHADEIRLALDKHGLQWIYLEKTDR
jgi:S1-C subfamily serine protease